ncbi:hypothetical protein F0344_01765 [Streptomyces finlayi]|uniref:Uncharacterized protein n=1 Tax=Streptomyces finlayi TaxID=67296 RepID=A0A7G7BDU3_9ACTN|nr:hypothetical protein [Streptomyces finlayi]QNE73508.1 hypothetical protein F0344_01765 [Streptomyces finlayi]
MNSSITFAHFGGVPMSIVLDLVLVEELAVRDERRFRQGLRLSNCRTTSPCRHPG